LQQIRRELGLEYTDRIDVVLGGGEHLRAVLGRHGPALAAEVLAVRVAFGQEIKTSAADAGSGARTWELDVEGEKLTAFVARVAP
jgi:hypothetical protein